MNRCVEDSHAYIKRPVMNKESALRLMLSHGGNFLLLPRLEFIDRASGQPPVKIRPLKPRVFINVDYNWALSGRLDAVT